MKTTIKYVFAATTVSFLAACGGGGGGGTAEQVTPPTLDLRTAWASYFQRNSSDDYSISGAVNGTSVGGTGTMIVSYVSPVNVLAIDPASPFPGPSINLTGVGKTTITTNATLIVNSNQSLISSSQEYYVDANGVFKMIKDVDDNEQTIVTSFTNFPSQVTSGSGGVLYTGTVYSRLGYTCGTETGTYSVSTESSSALIVTVTFTQNTTNQTAGQCSTQTSTSQNRYRLTATGLTPITSTGSHSTATGSITLTF